ncbi:MAG: hypothetical protein KatS3mg129_1196 [Leptospiraceae bacterium]|nr:MAG: hypothetical protein KatS3mg129_1196 [Leptospiraceae bacterium]
MFYFDSFKHPYILINKNIILPVVSLINFDLVEAEKIYQILLDNFPSFTEEFKIIKQDQIIGQKKYYSFIKIISDFSINVALELRILSSYAGGASKNEILNQPTQNYSPSFKTDRIYYYLFMYLVQNYTIDKDKHIQHLEPQYIGLIRNYKIPYTDTRIEPWTVGIFDDLDFGELLDSILKKIPYEWKAKIWKNPFTVERTTLALNLIHIEQYKYLVHDFIKFIKNIDENQFESKNFNTFFSDWEIERCFSKSGNIHWKFKKIPFINLP